MFCENDDMWLTDGGQPALSKEPVTDPGGHVGRATTQPVPLWTPGLDSTATQKVWGWGAWLRHPATGRYQSPV